MIDWSLIVSICALVTSAAVAWLTFGRRGQLKMTRPAVIFFGFDTSPGRPDAKVFFRGLLYSTANRGQLVEGMYVRLTRGESTQNFTLWVYGDKANLDRGSGLYVGKEGIAKNHHFLLAPDQSSFAFQPGDYTMEVVASLVGRSRSRLLFEATLNLSAEQAKMLEDREYGVYFDWGPESRSYHTKLDKRPGEADPQLFPSTSERKPVRRAKS